MREAHWGKEGPARLFNFELQRGSKCKEGMLNQHPLKPPTHSRSKNCVFIPIPREPAGFAQASLPSMLSTWMSMACSSSWPVTLTDLPS